MVEFISIEVLIIILHLCYAIRSLIKVIVHETLNSCITVILAIILIGCSVYINAMHIYVVECNISIILLSSILPELSVFISFTIKTSTL